MESVTRQQRASRIECACTVGSAAEAVALLTPRQTRGQDLICLVSLQMRQGGSARWIGGWLSFMCLPTLRSVQPLVRVDTAGVRAMAGRWGASVGELSSTVAPAGLGLACQSSVAAVDAAHIDVTAFTAGLAARLGARATGVAHADTGYLANEAVSAAELAAVASPATSV